MNSKDTLENKGFSLVEVVLSLGIFSFAIVAISGLMGASMKVTRDNEEQISAANVATILAGRYRELLEAEAKGLNVGSGWDKFPLPRDPTSSNNFEFFGLIDPLGEEENDIDKAAFGLSYLVDAKEIGGTGSKLVTCTLQLKWPIVAAERNTEDAPVNVYTTTTAFVLPPRATSL